MVGRAFGVSVATSARFDITKLAATLEAVHERLAGVVIECLPWPELLPRYDRAATLFYLDPPYWGCERDYGDGVFGRADFVALAEALGRLQGHFLLSLNDHPEVRRIFADFALEEVETAYGISARGPRRGFRELLISRR